jgi:biotin synthase-related radical SAM superfamily protein
VKLVVAVIGKRVGVSVKVGLGVEEAVGVNVGDGVAV